MDNLRKPAFSEEEYRHRLASAQRAMREKDLSLLLCHNLANICYLTGFQTLGSYGYGHYALVVPAEGNPTLLASDFESHNARIFCWPMDIVTYDVIPDTARGPVEMLADLIRERGSAKARIGYEAGHYALTIEEFSRLRDRLQEATLVEATSLLDPIKLIKSPNEITVIRRAAQLTTAGFLSAIEAVKEGAYDHEVAVAAYQTIVANGGEYFSIQPIVTTGKRSGIPHSTFRRERLERGDVVFVELSACHERYSAPAMRTVCVGEPTSEVRRAFSACLVSVETLLENIRGGASGRQIAMKAGRALRAIEPELVWHGYYGYSIGLTFPPACSDCLSGGDITESEEFILQPGMTFHCSTSLRKIGEFGVTVSETVLVTENGCEALTSNPRKIFVR